MMDGAMTEEFGAGQDKAKPVLPTYADRVADETARIAALKSRWTPPPEFGAPAAAPAAGYRVDVPDYAIVGNGFSHRVGGHMRAADIFDQMEADARRAHERKGDDTRFVALFTMAQLDVARLYRHLTERHDAGGMRCASLEAGRAGGGSGGGFIDAFVDEGVRLACLQRKIGYGVAMAVRRVRPSQRGMQATGIITDRQLVDQVCLGQLGLNAVLRGAGWTADGHHRKALRSALRAALDRMQGRGVACPTKCCMALHKGD